MRGVGELSAEQISTPVNTPSGANDSGKAGTPGQIFQIGAGEPVSAATNELSKVDALMVVEDGKPIGVITRHDLLAFVSTHPFVG